MNETKECSVTIHVNPEFPGKIHGHTHTRTHTVRVRVRASLQEMNISQCNVCVRH